jgi:hypothetical protein
MMANWFKKVAALIQIYPNSIEVNKTTRGYTFTVKLRCGPGEEDAILNRIKDLDEKLRNNFPGSDS